MTIEPCGNFPFCDASVEVTANATDTPFCAECEREEGRSIADRVALIAEVAAEYKLFLYQQQEQVS